MVVFRVFSQLKLIKNDRRTCHKEDTLDRLLQINVKDPPPPPPPPTLSDLDASGDFEL